MSSNNPSNQNQAVATLFGQDTEQRVGLTGWIADTPEGDAAFLLLYPHGHGIAQKMRVLADAAGTRSATIPGIITSDTAEVRLTAGEAEVWIRDWSYRRPVSTEWFALAQQRGWIVLAVGMDGWTGRIGDLDAYTARSSRLFFARVAVTREVT